MDMSFVIITSSIVGWRILYCFHHRGCHASPLTYTIDTRRRVQASMHIRMLFVAYNTCVVYFVLYSFVKVCPLKLKAGIGMYGFVLLPHLLH